MSYGGPVPPITPTIDGFVNGDDVTSLGASFACSTDATISSPISGSPYTSSCTGAVDANYDITYVNGKVDINTKPTLDVYASSETMVYGGSVPSIGATYVGWVGGDSASSLTTDPSCSTTALSTSPVGGYDSSCGGAVDDNYNIVYHTGTVTVTPAPLTITASSAFMTYGGPVPTITPIYDGMVNGDTAPAGLPTCSTTATATDDLGTSSPSTCSGASDPDYAITYVPGVVTVTDKHILLVTANDQSRLVGQANPTLTYVITGWVGSDGPSSLTDQPTCTTTAKASSPAGSYPIVCSGATSDKYAFNYVAGTLTVTAPRGTIVIGGASGTPRAATPPPTNTGNGSSNGAPLPLFVMLLCLAFGGLGLLAVQVQRRTIRR
jgi:hypothetical protein